MRASLAFPGSATEYGKGGKGRKTKANKRRKSPPLKIVNLFLKVIKQIFWFFLFSETFQTINIYTTA